MFGDMGRLQPFLKFACTSSIMHGGKKTALKRHHWTSSSVVVPYRRIPTDSDSQQQAKTTEEPQCLDVATCTYRARTDAPVSYTSWKPWRWQEWAHVGVPLVRLYRPFQNQTMADADRRANGACLPIPPGTKICECGVVVIHSSHENGDLHSRMSEEPR